MIVSFQPSVAVIVPTWRRPKDLERCLNALFKQHDRPSRIVVACKVNDQETHALIDRIRPNVPSDVELARVCVSAEQNVVAQQNAALDVISEDFIAITDDDAEPRPDWIGRLISHFQDSAVGGVGGRDWQPIERWDEPIVGRLCWYGKTIGNHHLGAGPPRDVEILKGVNCAFRGDLLREIGFDTRMRGRGTVINWELALSFAILRKGYRLVFDPAICVDHHIAVRQDGDINQRGGFEAASLFDNVFNESLSIHNHFGLWQRATYVLWSELIGTRGNPGMLQVPRLILKRSDSPTIVCQKYLVSLKARWAALVASLNAQRDRRN